MVVSWVFAWVRAGVASAGVGFGAFAIGCNVPEPPGTTGGAEVDAGPCGRGVVVSSSGADFASTNISLARLDGTPLSESFVSSASSPPGISAALSGDVVLPLETPESGAVVLIDRYPNAVITWLDAASAGVLGQLSVATGFASNPHDYLEVGSGRALVSRYETNPAPGKEPFDQGGDLLVIDTTARRIAARIGLARPADGALLPRPDHLMMVRDAAVVVLHRFDASFSAVGDARLLGVAPASGSIAWSADVAGLVNCGGVALSPDRTRLVLACSGSLKGGGADLAHSGVVVLDASRVPPVELSRHAVAAELGMALGPALGFASPSLLVGTAFGTGAGGDLAWSLDLATGKVLTLGASKAGFVLGDVRCAPACGAPCLLADAELAALRRWRVSTAGSLEELGAVKVDTRIGLLPRYLGGF